jgi:hypothetical protein
MAWKSKNAVAVNHITCSLCQASTVYLEAKPKAKIELLMDAYPSQEWLAYMVGR